MPTTTRQGTPFSAPAVPNPAIRRFEYGLGGKSISEATAVGAAKHFAIFDAMLRELQFGIASKYDPYHMLVLLRGHGGAYVRALPPSGITENGTYVFRLKAADRPSTPEIDVYALVALDIPAIVWIRSCDIRKSVRITKAEFLDKDRSDRDFDLCFAEAILPANPTPRLVERGSRVFDFGGDDAAPSSLGPQLVGARRGDE